MIEFPIHGGAIAFIDDEDRAKVSWYRWYPALSGSGRVTYARTWDGLTMHHHVFGYPPGDLVVDHINGNGLDNQKHNLRFVTRGENVINSHKKGSTGIYYREPRKRWVVLIRRDGELNYVGSYTSEEAAVDARDNWLTPDKLYQDT